LTAELQQSFFARLPAELINLYGPTEATIDATFWTCRRESGGGIVPIGRPISNAVAYVLDRYGNPVPIGVTGELFLGGAGLARAYWDRPGLTAEKFIPNAFSDQPGSRLYRTGDLARYLSDGSLQYLGRLDQQVKVRGFRLELGEIESILASLPSVRECAVVARQSDSGETSLVAYLAVEEKRTSTTRELRRALSQKLPEPLVPSVFVTLDRLPRTPAGKVDRQALPRPGGERLERPARYAAPRTPLEEALAGIWAALLRRDRVGIHDNFFALGGHSLMAMRVLLRVRQAYGVDLPLRTLFETPTVAGLGLAVLHRLAVEEGGREISGLLAALQRVSEKEALRLLADESRSGERLGSEEDPNLEGNPVVAEGERGAR
jgi:acyl carrier protein